MNNILIIDHSLRTVSLLNLIVTEFTNYQATIETKKNNIINLLEHTSFEYIIIDHIIEHADEIIAYILNKDPKQKVILLSDHIKCPVSCDDCFSLFQFVRLIKPVKPRTILNYLDKANDFLCPNKDKLKSITGNMNINEIFKIENLVNESFFKMEVNVNNEIEITVK